MAKTRSTDILTFENVDGYDEYQPGNYIIKQIIINGIRTHYYIRNDGKFYSSYRRSDGILRECAVIKMNKKKCVQENIHGYCCIHMSVDNKSYIKLLHRVVAIAFIEIPRKYISSGYDINTLEVNHKDGDKWNNNVSNLEWATPSENMLHSFNTHLHPIVYGDNHWNSKLTSNDVVKICECLEENSMSLREISEMIGCSKSDIQNIRNRYSWINISKNYDIDKYDVKESHSGLRRMNDDIVYKICEDLESGLYTMREISKKYDIPYGRVNDIKQRNTWSRISKSFNFDNYKSK